MAKNSGKFPKAVDRGILQTGEYSFRLRMMHRGVMLDRTLDTLAEAQALRDSYRARRALDSTEESVFKARAQKKEAQKGVTVGEALEKYLKEVTPTKKGARDEGYRIGKARRTALASKPIVTVTREDIDEFLDEIGGSENNKRKYASLISHLYWTAKNARGWRWPVENPVAGMALPSNGDPRERRLLGNEYELLSKSLKGESQLMFIVAVETAMRRSEQFALDWKFIDWENCSGLLPDTKNGTARTTYFSDVAMRALEPLRKGKDGKAKEMGRVFSVTQSQLRKDWESARDKIGASDLHWHDLRHEATSRLFAKGLNVFEVQSITGHKTLEELKKYTHLAPNSIIEKLNKK